jgi:hypothetical protein
MDYLKDNLSSVERAMVLREMKTTPHDRLDFEDWVLIMHVGMDDEIKL